VARVRLEASPGPVVTVDSIRFLGNYRLDEETLRRQLAVRRGGRLRATDLVRSQRNLFELELVEFASVEVAPERLQLTPDSLQLLEDSIGSTVLVRIIEAARYAAEIAVAYGSRDCIRGEATHLDRNFLGGARRLEVTGLIAKVGVGDPLNGLEQSLCPAFDPESRFTPEDSLIADQLNWRLAANFLQPRLFGTQTSVVLSGFTERISELVEELREKKEVSFFQTFAGLRDTGRIVATFLAILEMARLKLIRVRQPEPEGDILITSTGDQGNLESVDDYA
jgi:hypothetical protein